MTRGRAGMHNQANRHAILLAAAAMCLAVGATGCATGKSAPAMTPMGRVTQGLVFQFGMGVRGCDIPRTDAECKAKAKGFDSGQPAVTVRLKPFEIDVHEVTNEQYDYCVEMGACSLPAGDNGHGVQDYFRNLKYRKHPVVLVRWQQAVEYCKFAGNKRLPTEFEWERVAGGPAADTETKRLYTFLPDLGPDVLIPQNCQKLVGGELVPIDVNLYACTPGVTLAREVMTSEDDAVPVEAAKAGENALIYDLAGNVAEWTASDAGDLGKFPYKVTCNGSLPYDCEPCTQCLKVKGVDSCNTECNACTCGTKDKAQCYTPCANPVCPVYPPGYEMPGWYTGQNFSPRRVIRGGSHDDGAGATAAPCAGRSDTRNRSQSPKDDPLDFLGFRCARSL